MMDKIVDLVRVLFDIQFPASGSLFFKDFLDTGVKVVDIPRNSNLEGVNTFCIGLLTKYL